MKEVKDLNKIEYAIYYWNNSLSIILCASFIYYNWQVGIITSIGGYIFYKTLWFYRRAIYQMGLSRFHFLAIIFYLSFVLSFFIKLDTNYYVLSKPDTDISHIDTYLTYIAYNIPKLLHLKHIIFSFAVGVLLYVINVEFRRTNIIDRDLMGIQIEPDELFNLNLNIHLILFLMLCCCLLWISYLGLIALMIVECCLLYPKRQSKIIMLLICCIIIIATTIPSYSNMIFVLPNIMITYLLHFGAIAFIKLQLKNTFGLFVESASIWLLPYIIIKLTFELSCSKNTYSKIKEQNLNRQSHQKYNKSDFIIGTNLDNGKQIGLSDKELNQHMFIIGTTGAGKTVAILNMVVHCANKNYPLIFLDGKGQTDLVERLSKIAQHYNRKFRVFTLRPEAIPSKYQHHVSAYNPFASGTFTEWKNRILSLFAEVRGKGQQHFALMEEDLINSVAQVLFKMNKTIDLDFLYTMLSNIDIVIEAAHKYNDDKLAHKLEQIDKALVKDVAIMLGLFVESSYGQLFKTQNQDNVISLRSAIENNEMVLFLLDSSSYKSDTEKMAKLIINDINSSFSELNTPKYSYCVFDEFASYASSNLSDTISLMRSKGMCAIIGTQSIVSVSLKSEETKRVAEELKSCCNTYLCLAINNEQDAEIMSKVYNTRDVFEVTTQIDVSVGGATGMGSSKSIKAFNVHPEQLKNLSTGEGFLYRKAGRVKPVRIVVRNGGY